MSCLQADATRYYVRLPFSSIILAENPADSVPSSPGVNHTLSFMYIATD